MLVLFTIILFKTKQSEILNGVQGREIDFVFLPIGKKKDFYMFYSY